MDDVDVTGTTILVTAAGGPAGVAVIQALRAARHRVVAADADPLAVGLRLADDCAVVPRSDVPSYVDQLCRLAEKTKSDALVTTLAEEIPVLVRRWNALEDAGLCRWLPSVDAVTTCLDKWRFANVAGAGGGLVPATGLHSNEGVPGPWVVKPRFGRGSRDVYMIDDRDALTWAMSQVEDPIVQTRLSGREFTVDALVDRDGSLAGAVPRWRIATHGGISVTGETFVSAPLVAEVQRLVQTVGLVGPANVQGFVGYGGEIAFTEINPRFSGALPLSLAAGADFVGEFIRGVFGLPIRRERLAYRSGVKMLRHFAEIFEE